MARFIFGLRRQRKLGVTRTQVIFRTKKLVRAGAITKNMSVKEAALIVAADAASENEELEAAWSKVSAPDWDAILAFIEKLLALLLPLLV